MPRSSGATVTPFKDILSLNNSTERVAKFNETRVAFAVMDTGLDRWLTNLHQDHPEHHSKSFNSYQPAAAPASVPPGAQQPAQQPYYQQYLNASAPGSGSSPGRRIGGISMPSHVGGSTFGHSGNQIGTKSKELMQSAGKMGKGLFSKGKNKLRGDKGETHPQQPQRPQQPPPPPPPAQTKAKHDRSGSWAVLSSKLRTEFSSSKDHEQQHQQHHQQPHEEEYYAAPRASMTVAPQIPVPEPVSPLLREATPDRSFPAAQTASGQRRSDYPTGAVSAPLSSATSSSIPAAGHQIRVVPSEPASHGPVVGAPAVPPPVTEDSGVGMLQQSDESDDAPKRQSSFVGLPPIRRSSTFGMKSKARRAAERFPLDEEEDNGVPGLPTSDVMEHPASEPEAPQQLTRREHLPGATVVQAVPSLQPPTTTTDKDGIVVHHQPVSAEHYPERPAVQPVMAATPSQPPTMRPSQPPHPPVMLHPGQSGPWRLEESHLAEPLHQAKNRSGHSPISPPMNYGFDKETGQMPPPPVPANNNMRQRNTADVPPSSAQRYPGLFAPRPDQELTPQQQRQMSNSQAYYEEMANPRHSGSEFAIPGVGPPTEERGRAKRNSGIFKEIGDKIARATSRDRKNSFADASRPPTDAYTDEASESSFGTEEMQDRKKKRRSSILNSLTGRASMDQGSRQSFSALQRSQTEAAVANSSSEDLGSARKRSVFGGVMAGFSGNKNAPTSGLANQQSAADDEPQLTPKKKRFSAITKAFQRPNQERPSSGLSLEPTESAGSSQNPNARSGILSSMPFRNRDRSDSAAQMDPAGSEHNRRASFSNLLSSLTGNKGQQQQQQQQHPDQQYQQYQNQPSTPSRSFAANDLPQDIPSAPRQQHAADDFPTPNRDAGAPPPTLPAQFLDRPQPLFAADENKWGIDRPPTAATVTASERPKTDAGESIASSAAMVPSISSLPLPFAAATAETSAKRDDPVAPSEVSDSETDIAETSRKPSDVTPSVMTGADEESEDMTHQDTNVSQVTPSVVTDLPRLDEPQEHTPTAQYPNSPGGYYTHNSGTPGAAPLSAGPQGYPQAQSQGPVHHQQDPRRSFTGPAYGPGMGQAPPGPQYGQQQHQQYMQGGFAQPAQPSEPSAASSNRWKGLKTKMAGQMASISQSSPGSKSQDKQEKSDKSASGDKLFNAFKRLSKQQSPSPGPGPADAPQSPGAQARSKRLSNAQPPVMTPVMTQLPEGMQPAPQGGGMSPGFRVFPRNQGQPVMGQSQQMPPHMQHQQMPPHMQHQQMPPHMQHQQMPPHMQHQQMPPHMQHQQMPPHIQHQQMHPQQMHMGPGYHRQQGHPQQQLSMYMQQQQQQQKQGEPQYAAVPVPQGYNSAYNQDGAQPQSMYNVSRQYSQHQTPYQQQQNHASHYQPHGQQTGGYQQHGNGFEHSQPQSPLSEARRESQPHEPLSQQVSATGSELLSPVTQRSGSLPLSPTSDEPRSPHAALTREALAQQDARKDLQAHHLRPEESRTSLGPSNSNRVSQVSNDSGRQRRRWYRCRCCHRCRCCRRRLARP
ncbi:hypothetical protein PWT90_10892 [Aphanocladium album]|nr:hypothetical protein PWT90_10892 [Aphanocladium album]